MAMVSVIVPVYNVEKYLHRCVDSILAQTFTDFELILVDDGSPDNCGTICDEYARKDSRVRVIHKSNGGVSDARNVALDVAKGVYVAFCDGDDFWCSDFLEKAQGAFIDESIDVVVLDYITVDENNERIKVTNHKNHQEGIVEYKEEATKYEYILKYLLEGEHGWEACTRVFKAEVIQKYSIRFSTDCGNYAEDLGFVAEYTLCSKKANSISEGLYCYRKRIGSMMYKSKQCVKLDQVNQVSYQIYNRYMDMIRNREYRRRYSVLHFLILYIELQKMIWSDSYCELGKAFGEMRNGIWSRSVLKELYGCRSYLLEHYGKRFAVQILLSTHYCIHGNWNRFRYESAIAYRWLIEKE